MPCLGNDTILHLAADRSADRLARFEAHLDECAECRRLVGELAELSWMRVSRGTEHDAPSAAQRTTLARGRVIDRYIIIELLGAGGMGVVYAAYDPRLDRKIALKVLRPDLDGHDRGARLLHEAKTLARLRHPNVVAVHDAGTFEQQVFVAMELVDGMTLREWLREPRDWQEIVRVFLEAARGLEAAHAAGIVHRDFKPDNVLIDLAGRAQVADFGLARSNADRASAAVVGTPAYMSPEQRRGEAVTDKSDQFSFCVALHEALGNRRAPARITAAVARGMHEDPARRFASMHDLSRALRRRSLIVPAVSAVAAVACVALAAIGVIRTAHSQPPPCGDAKAKLAHVWDGSMREMLRLRFVATGRADANEQFATIAKRLDDYTITWLAEHTDACEATHVRGEQSQQLLDQRMGCLDTRLGELATRIDILHEVTPDNLDTLPHLFDALVEPSTCKSRSVLRRTAAAPPRGLVSTFDAGTLATSFGAGWSVSTDAIMGGRSRGELHVAGSGDRTAHALSVTGSVEQAQSPIAWSGAMFYPGGGPMAPVDLSAFHYIAFSARGDGGNYEVLLFSQSKGDLPAFQLFPTGPAWKQYRFALADFDGVNPGDIKGLLFASNRTGPYSLQIDQVRFE